MLTDVERKIGIAMSTWPHTCRRVLLEYRETPTLVSRSVEMAIDIDTATLRITERIVPRAALDHITCTITHDPTKP